MGLTIRDHRASDIADVFINCFGRKMFLIFKCKSFDLFRQKKINFFLFSHLGDGWNIFTRDLYPHPLIKVDVLCEGHAVCMEEIPS